MYRKKSGFFFLAGSAGTWLSFQRLVSFRTRISHPSVCFFYSFLLLSIIPSPCVQCVGRPNRFQHKINGPGSRLNHPFPMHDRARRRRARAGRFRVAPMRARGFAHLPGIRLARRVWTPLTRWMREKVPSKSSFTAFPH